MSPIRLSEIASAIAEERLLCEGEMFDIWAWLEHQENEDECED